jgi:hypothetical protein
MFEVSNARRLGFAINIGANPVKSGGEEKQMAPAQVLACYDGTPVQL